jgi:L-seryl-tRNA(Ser) seleniumtransferase
VLAARAEALGLALGQAAVPCQVRPVEGRVGGGSMPTATLASWAVLVETGQPDRLMDRLRAGEPPVVARIVDGAVALDVRCLADADLEPLAGCVRAALG